ncbi:hypothetical protein IWQ60_007986 [Tieghemiomyces parasiticus]|uniref:Phosphoribosyltransferase domain-containing protein n=1 Tax=Tieghemiomyces parasiticus TaxID=78921 RepID=A0A9W7ZZT3_9FUNG|nr:hypothetical protein IWQ60_007986 [Tieghemiomyces parasiticus]
MVAMCSAPADAVNGGGPGPRTRCSSTNQPKYADRLEGGAALARQLFDKFQGRTDTTVLAISRAGLVVADVVGEALGLPVAAFYVRQIRSPDHPKLSLGAVTSGRLTSYNTEIIEGLGLTPAALEATATAANLEMEHEQTALAPRYGHTLQNLLASDHPTRILLVDDGIVSGDDVRSAVDALQRHRPGTRITVATPIGVADTMRLIARRVEATVVAYVPVIAYKVPSWYETGTELSAEEVARISR